jgi:hypothetical protein
MVSLITATTALNPNQEMTDFNYKKYSLENLENWMHDAMSAGEATPQEIYDVIKSVVEENYYTYKQQAWQAYELLALLNGNGKGHIKEYDDCVDKILSCDKDDPSPECQKSWTNFWENAQCPPYVSEDGDMWAPDTVVKEDKVIKWQLPVEIDGASGEYYVQFPDDLMEAANITENDMVEWVDQGDGSYILRKVGEC